MSAADSSAPFRLGGGRCRGHAITKVARLAAVQAAREVSDSLARANVWGDDTKMRGLAVYLAYRLESDAHDLAVALALLEQGRGSDAYHFLTDVLKTATEGLSPDDFIRAGQNK